jgi:Uncharacterized protein conserved in bacteria (DUF2252)
LVPCGIALFMAADDDPIFLQIKEAKASVLEPYVGKSLHENHGERVVVGQRLMQSASDIFLGWLRGEDGRDHYIRQLRDTKMTALIEAWDFRDLRAYGRLMPDRETPRGLRATWVPIQPLTTLFVSSRSNTPTRTNVTTEPSSRRSGKDASR